MGTGKSDRKYNRPGCQLHSRGDYPFKGGILAAISFVCLLVFPAYDRGLFAIRFADDLHQLLDESPFLPIEFECRGLQRVRLVGWVVVVCRPAPGNLDGDVLIDQGEKSPEQLRGERRMGGGVPALGKQPGGWHSCRWLGAAQKLTVLHH